MPVGTRAAIGPTNTSWAQSRPVRRARAILDRLRTGYWLVPTSCAVAAVAAAIGLIAVDRFLDRRGTPAWTYAGGPQNASDTLSTIASSMITFTGLVFSITLLALQLTSSQFSPRAVRGFLRDRVAQLSLGVFVGTFAYAFAALSAVRVASSSDPGFVPAVTVTGAFLLIALSLLMFVRFIHHMASSIRVESIIGRIAMETRRSIDACYPRDADRSHSPPPTEAPGTPVRVVVAARAGVLVDVDLEGLAEEAAARGGVARVLHGPGAFVCEGQPLVRLIDLAGHQHEVDWHRFVRLGAERTMLGDDVFGVRQLVDIAERALSPGINDPTTAVQCLDQIHDVLRRLLGRHLPGHRTAGHDGAISAWMPAPTFDDHLRLGLDEIVHWGTGSLQVRRRVAALLDDLHVAAADAQEVGAIRRAIARASVAFGREPDVSVDVESEVDHRVPTVRVAAPTATLPSTSLLSPRRPLG